MTNFSSRPSASLYEQLITFNLLIVRSSTLTLTNCILSRMFSFSYDAIILPAIILTENKEKKKGTKLTLFQSTLSLNFSPASRLCLPRCKATFPATSTWYLDFLPMQNLTKWTSETFFFLLELLAVEAHSYTTKYMQCKMTEESNLLIVSLVPCSSLVGCWWITKRCNTTTISCRRHPFVAATAEDDTYKHLLPYNQ